MLESDFKSFIHQVCDANLVAVSKKQSPAAIKNLYSFGQRHFAENYVQEGISKVLLLNEYPDITWHFIGQIQSNKTKLIAQHFHWVQSVDRLSIAQRLQQHCAELDKKLNICISVNIDNEAQKSGVLVNDIGELLTNVANLSHLYCRGLMVIPKARKSPDEQYKVFAKVKELFDSLNQKGFELDTLSMGMSQDYKEAIKAGSTMVRIGTKLFGLREV